MRSKLLTALTLGMMVSMVIGCGGDDKKDNNDNSNPLAPGSNSSSTTEGTVSIELSGALTDEIVMNGCVGSYSPVENWMGINGTINNGQYTIMIEVVATKSGTYAIKGVAEAGINEGYGMFMVTMSQSIVTYNSISGSISFSDTKPKMKGSFNIMAQNTLTGETITLEGAFNIPAINIDE